MRYRCKRCSHYCHAGPSACDRLEYHGGITPESCGCPGCTCFSCVKTPHQLEFPLSAYTPTDAKGIRVY